MTQKQNPLAFRIANGIIMALVVAVCLFPFLYCLAVSFSSTYAVANGLVTIFPVEFTTSAYREFVNHPSFFTGYGNTFLYTLLGTSISLVMTIMAAYALSKVHVRGMKALSKFVIFTMYFSGGLIPNYLLITSLGMRDTIWAIVIPRCIDTFNLIVMRTGFMSVPESLEEAATIDGLNPIQILVRIVVPLSKSVISTIALFYAVGYWNDWFNAMLYIDSAEKQPIMMVLRNIVVDSEIGNSNTQKDLQSLRDIATSSSLKSAGIMLSSIPILLVYPFVQKYFVKGVMIGAVKE
jgi:putative aldouronate transport system permease protein